MYTPLYIKTDNSLLESLIKIQDLIDYAKKNNYKALTIADNTMYGVKEFYDECIKNDIKPIIGFEINYNDLNYIIYAINNEGYKNIVKLSTIINTANLSMDLINKYSSNLICILPYNSFSLYDELSKIYKYIYIGYKNKEEFTNLKYSNIVYMNEIKALNKDDTKYLKYLIAMKKGILVDEVINDNSEFYIHDADDEIISNTIKTNQDIINMCDVKIEYENDLMPVFTCPDNMDSSSYLKKLCVEGLKEKFGDKTYQIYIDRLKYELDVINNMGFCNYFLIVADYVKFSKDNDIFCYARGSAAGSLVAYLLNISAVDPIKYNLIFERFLNSMRISMPDIDMDFEDTKRSRVIDYCINKYGNKNVAGIVTFITLKPKLAIRDVGRVMDFEQDEIDKICKMIKDVDNHKPISLMDNYKINNELAGYLKADKRRLELYKIALKFENIKKTTGIHAAGIIICNKDLDEVVPLIKSGNMYLTGYSMNYLEPLGLLKMDFLGLKNLTIISNILNDLKHDNIIVDFDNISLDDKETLDIFKTANTIGIFQFESEGMRNFLLKLKPSCFEDIFSALALYRPGPMGNIDTFIRRKHGKEKINYYHPDLEPILKPTYGIIIYQEQIMQIVSVMADYTLGEADLLRKAISKKKDSIMLENINEFKERALKKGYDIKVVEEVADFIVKFASYGFNRSHSVVYAIIAYKLAYLKAHYKAYFMRFIMTNAIGRSLTTRDYIYECKINNLEVLNPDINYSDKVYTIYNNKIRYPLTNIKNVGAVVVDYILDERKKGLFTGIYDFIKRCYSKTVNKKVLTSLILAGCFDSFKLNRKTLINSVDEIITYGELSKGLDVNSTLKPDIEFKEEYTKNEIMQFELDMFGFYLSKHPVTDLKIKYKNNIDLKDISNYFNKNVSLIVNVKYIKAITTKKNDEMGFITGEDESGLIDIIVFPNLFKKLIDLKPNVIIKLIGRVEKRYDKYQVIANQIDVIK